MITGGSVIGKHPVRDIVAVPVADLMVLEELQGLLLHNGIGFVETENEVPGHIHQVVLPVGIDLDSVLLLLLHV